MPERLPFWVTAVSHRHPLRCESLLVGSTQTCADCTVVGCTNPLQTINSPMSPCNCLASEGPRLWHGPSCTDILLFSLAAYKVCEQLTGLSLALLNWLFLVEHFSPITWSTAVSGQAKSVQFNVEDSQRNCYSGMPSMGHTSGFMPPEMLAHRSQKWIQVQEKQCGGRQGGFVDMGKQVSRSA
jgi:hypothetical protein